MLPLGFGLLLLQAWPRSSSASAWLQGMYEMDTHYEKPLQ